ncbi:unnamed protein product, partial [Timema podura]|nr:unnamed protein product [Timema podura]
FANRVLESGPNPRVGKKSDQAHPPIHPTKYTCNLEDTSGGGGGVSKGPMGTPRPKDNFLASAVQEIRLGAKGRGVWDVEGDEWRVYEFVVRHFLACCSKDAEGLETVVDIDINEEKFVASGLMIIARNYLDVYPYDKWSGKEIHVYQQGQTFEPTNIEMTEGTTSAPNLLTEADLIALMEKHGIGTDATHADHIEKIKSRLYVGLENDNYFVPGQLGMGLVEGYDSMGFPMSKPNLRAELEADLKRVCEGTRNPAEVLREQLAKYKDVFRIAIEQAAKLDTALGQYLEEQAQPPGDSLVTLEETPEPAMKCPSCGLDMVLKTKRDGTSKYLSCMAYPQCRSALWFPRNVEGLTVSEQSCPQCGPDVKKLNFKFRRGSMIPYCEDNYTGCVGGCDLQFLEMLDIETSGWQANPLLQQMRVKQQLDYGSIAIG